MVIPISATVPYVDSSYCSTSTQPLALVMILQARILEWVNHFLFQGIFPTPGVEPRSPTLEADTLTSEPPGKPMPDVTFSLLMNKNYQKQSAFT